MSTKICPQCSTEYSAEQRFCPIDGSTLKSQGPAGDLVGSVIADRYHVLRKLGEGGMGQVYLAEHVRMGRRSALKVMHPRMVQDADAISRFNREASNASRINHPNVAAIYDFGETDDGLIYLAMEYVDGEPLTALVERSGTLPPLRAADIVRQAADALSVAHEMGIVHRDLKPDNIMLTRNRDGSDCVKVVDFGIAKAEGASQKVTKTGLVIGTPEYMSPEQLAADTIDGRSDTYSLGIVAFNLLTGMLPFPSNSAQESMIMRLTDRPRRLDEMRPDVAWPAELQAVMDRALAREAELRYATAAEFGRDLARAVERMPESAAMSAGTMVLGATEVLVPATRVAADAASGVGGGGSGATLSGLGGSGAATQIGAVAPGGGGAPDSRLPAPDAVRAPRPRTAIIAAVAVLVIGGGAAAALKVAGNGAPGAVPPDSSSALVSPAGDPAAGGAAGPGTAPDSRPPASDAVRYGASESRLPTADGARTPDSRPQPPDGVRTSSAVRAVLARVEKLTSAATTEENGRSARAAIAELDRIAGSLVKGSEDHTWAQLLRAEAHAALNQGEQMCAILGTIQGTPDDATRAERISLLNSACP